MLSGGPHAFDGWAGPRRSRSTSGCWRRAIRISSSHWLRIGFVLDLLYRLNVVTVKVPALRDRGEDVWLLAQHFLDHYRRRLGRPPATLAPEVQAALSSYGWPGNVRELRNVMERAAILSDGEVLRRRDLPEELAVPPEGRAVEFEPDLTLAELERRYILETLRRCGGNQTRAGQKLGVTARTLYNKLQKWGIEPGS